MSFLRPLDPESTRTSWSTHHKLIEIFNMFTAYVPINTEIGSKSDVLAALKKVENVEKTHNLWGGFTTSPRE